MLANALLALSAIGFVTLVVNGLMSDQQREALSNWCIKTWYRLDGMKRRIFQYKAYGFPLFKTILYACAFATVNLLIRLAIVPPGWDMLYWISVGIASMTAIALTPPSLVLAAMGIIWALELLVRRIAESKGILAAVSSFCGALGG